MQSRFPRGHVLFPQQNMATRNARLVIILSWSVAMAPVFRTVLIAIGITACVVGCARHPLPHAAIPPATQPARSPLFSEDFESGQLDPKIWTKEITGPNLLELQQDNVAHGKYALRVRCPVPSNKTWAFITMHQVPEALQKHHFGRCYMFISPQVPARHTIFIMGGTPGFPRNKFQEIATANGRWQLTYVDLRPSGDKEDYHAGSVLPTNRWFCLEWEFDDAPNRIAIWVDGEPTFETGFVSKATGARENLIGAFTDYAFGLRLWGDAPAPFDIIYDDIALDTKRIGRLADVAGPK